MSHSSNATNKSDSVEQGDRSTVATPDFKVMLENLREDVVELLKKQSELVTCELKEKSNLLMSAARAYVNLFVFSLLTVTFLSLSALIGLSLVMPMWAAALVVTGSLFLISLYFYLSAQSKLDKNDLELKNSKESMKYATQKVKEKMNAYTQ